MSTLRLLAALLCLLPVAGAVDFMPIVTASIHDEPRDGLGDTFNSSPFEGLLREQSTREDRAIQEFDVSSLSGMTVVSATLTGRVQVNNAFDVGVRGFDFLLYDGNGVADLSDFEIPGMLVGTDSYWPPMDTSFNYSFDVTTELQTLIMGGSQFVGLKVDCNTDPNFPNILDDATSLLSVTAMVIQPPVCLITVPSAGAMLSGDVPVTFDGMQPGSLPLTSQFEFSLDAGVTWNPATAAGGSALANPDPMRPTPFTGVTFLWDSVADGVGSSMAEMVDLRVTVDDGTSTAECLVSVTVDNSALCTTLCGDCDESGVGPGIVDALAAAQISAGLFTPSMAQTGCCDVNSDTTISILDALAIAQTAAGLPTVLVCP